MSTGATATKSQLRKQGGNPGLAELQQETWKLPPEGCSSSHHALLIQVGYSHFTRFAQPVPGEFDHSQAAALLIGEAGTAQGGQATV